MNSPIPEIKEKLSIVDVISSYMKVEQSGKNYKARCPFHNEKTPSFFISPDRNTYYCFGCSAKGDIFSFVENFEGTDFLGALKILASRAGVELTRSGSYQTRDERERWYEIMEEATTFFENNFLKEDSARAYLRERGLADETIKSFRIGYAPNTWHSVSDYLIGKGYDKKDLEIVGLIKTTDKGSYDRFRGRIMFPINDSSGRVIAFSGRIFGRDDTEEAKYLNSPDTPLYNKSNVLFGIDKAKNVIRTRGYSVMVEGQMDLILSHQAGFVNTVAVSGTALADDTRDSEAKINNLGLIRRLSPNVIFAYDGDSAGIRAAGRSALIALLLDMQVKIAVLPEGQDPADIIHASIDNWKEIIKNSVNIVSFHIDKVCANTSDMRMRGRKIREIVFPFLSMVKSAIERSAYISEINKKTGIQERALIEDFENYERINSVAPIKPEVENKNSTNKILSRRDNLERKFFGILFWKDVNSEITELVNKHYAHIIESIGHEVVEAIKTSHEAYREALAFEAEMWYGGKTEVLARDIEEVTLNLEEEILQERLFLLLEKMNQSTNSEAKNEMLQEYQNISMVIQDIKSRRTQ